MLPAHAGMTPVVSSLPPRCVNVPRACGDDPEYNAGSFRCTVCSPRLRGCPLDSITRINRYRMFPAPAGMTPGTTNNTQARQHVPQPKIELGVFGSMLPAHAGMTLLFLGGLPARENAPRACGDDPRPVGSQLIAKICSPRMRG